MLFSLQPYSKKKQKTLDSKNMEKNQKSKNQNCFFFLFIQVSLLKTESSQIIIIHIKIVNKQLTMEDSSSQNLVSFNQD